MAELQLGQSMTVESSTWTRKPRRGGGALLPPALLVATAHSSPVPSPRPPKETCPRAAAIAAEEVSGAVTADASRLQMLGLAACVGKSW